jgi:hypothetical protein
MTVLIPHPQMKKEELGSRGALLQFSTGEESFSSGGS